MKRISTQIYVFIIVCTALLTSCSTPNIQTRYRLKGNVKSTIETYSIPEYKFGEWQAGEIFSYNRFNFEEDGSTVTLDQLSDEEDLLLRVIDKYEYKNITEESIYSSSGRLELKLEFKHNSDDLDEYVMYNEQGEKVASGQIFKKNNGLPIRAEEIYLLDDVKVGRSIVQYKYDRNDDFREFFIINQDNDTTEYNRFEYLCKW